jgi:hypothetical protein
MYVLYYIKGCKEIYNKEEKNRRQKWVQIELLEMRIIK